MCTADAEASSQLAIAQQDRLAGVRIHGELPQHHIGKQGGGFDIAVVPAGILRGDATDPVLERRRIGDRQRCAESKHRAGDLGQRRVIATVLGAACHLQ